MKLTRKQALDLIPCILDGEATEKERRVFFEYIEDDKIVKKQFDSLRIVKELIRNKCKREKAPDHLKSKVNELIADMGREEYSYSKVDNSPNSLKTEPSHPVDDKSASTKNNIYRLFKPLRYVAAAAVIFFFTIITIELLERTSTPPLPETQNLEEVVFTHFENSDNSSAVLSSITPDDINHASEYLEAEFSFFPRMPLFDGAELTEVIYSSFIDGYNAPILKFHQEDLNENIYVFAFKVDELEKEYSLKRDPEAVKHCQSNDDYHIREVNGKHVVSWKWGDYWYSAVSNHHGNEVISMVDPMHKNSNGR